MDDPAFGRVPWAAARSHTRKRVPGCTRKYVEEGDSAASWKDASDNEGIHLKASWYNRAGLIRREGNDPFLWVDGHVEMGQKVAAQEAIHTLVA